MVEYPLYLLVIEVLLHSFLAIVAKLHQFDVMEVKIELSSAGPKGGLTSQLRVVKFDQTLLPFLCVLLTNTEMEYRFLNYVEKKLLILLVQP